MYVAKTKALICGFVFSYANFWFSHAAAHIVEDINRTRYFRFNLAEISCSSNLLKALHFLVK